MKIAIHSRPGSFSDRWIEYCKKKNISYKIVNCYDYDIIEQMDDCEGLMWHWQQDDYKAYLFARQLALSLEIIGKRVFPDVNTAWHFDDKVGQMYLLNAVESALVNSYVFYSKKDAVKWLNTTTFPKVFKLRGGAGSINVQLVKNKKKAFGLIKKAFGKGFSHYNRISRLKNRFWDLKRDRDINALVKVFGGIARLFISTDVEKYSHKERGYIYFQDFIPKNNYDTRIVVIGDRCFGLRRFCRDGDFRASGSGMLDHNPNLIDKKFIEMSFSLSKKIRTQSLALDFIWDGEEPKLIEISYCFSMGKSYDDCPGYWDSNLKWNKKAVNPQIFMVEDFIKKLSNL